MVWQVKALAAKLVTCVQIYDPYSEGGEPIPVVCPLIHVTCMHTHMQMPEVGIMLGTFLNQSLSTLFSALCLFVDPGSSTELDHLASKPRLSSCSSYSMFRLQVCYPG